MFSLALFLALYAPAFRGVLEPRRVIAVWIRCRQIHVTNRRRSGPAVMVSSVAVSLEHAHARASRRRNSSRAKVFHVVFIIVVVVLVSRIFFVLVFRKVQLLEVFILGLSAEARHGIEFDLLALILEFANALI